MEKITCVKTITTSGNCENITFEFDTKQEARNFMNSEWSEAMDNHISDIADTSLNRINANIRFENGDYLVWAIVDSNVTSVTEAFAKLDELVANDERLNSREMTAVLTLWLTTDGKEYVLSVAPNLYNEYYHLVGSNFWLPELTKYINEIEMDPMTCGFIYTMNNLPIAEFLDMVRTKNVKLLDYEIDLC